MCGSGRDGRSNGPRSPRTSRGPTRLPVRTKAARRPAEGRPTLALTLAIGYELAGGGRRARLRPPGGGDGDGVAEPRRRGRVPGRSRLVADLPGPGPAGLICP